jgi:hypothetical protein
LNAARKRSKKKAEKKDATDGAGASDDVALMTPLARYTSPPPKGMKQKPELTDWVCI